MEFNIEQDRFNQALKRVQGVVDKRNTIPLLANVLIEVFDGHLRITASDGEIAFTEELAAQVKSTGAICVPAKHLYEIIRQLPSAEIHLRRLENDWLEILCSGSYFKIAGLGTEGFPGIPEIDSQASFVLGSRELGEMIEGVLFSVATDDSRYGLNGAFLEMVEEDGRPRLRMISTDGHRLSLVNRDFIGDAPELDQGVLLPRKGLQELKKICGEPLGDSVQITLGDGNGLFQLAGLTFFMRFLEGEFPDYRQVIPQQHVRTVVIKREEFVNALRRVSVLSSEKTHSVRFNLSDGELEFFASNQELGESHECVAAEVSGGSLSIGFNARYFLDALAVISDEEIVLELGESLHPAVLRPMVDRSSLYVVMPMRIE